MRSDLGALIFGVSTGLLVAAAFVLFTILITQSAIGGAIGWGILFLMSLGGVTITVFLFFAAIWD